MAKGKKASKKKSADVASSSLAPQKPKNFVYFPYLLFAIACLAYSNTLFNDYTVDDTIVITDNQYTKKGLEGIGTIFTTDAFEGFFGKRGARLVEGGRYRPLSIATFAVEHQFFGLNPMISHAINVLLYGICCLLIYLLLRSLFESFRPNLALSIWLPLIASLLYALHPIHTEAVANIKGRDEIMGMLFAVWALWQFILFARKGDLKHLIIALPLFFLGLLSKENVITFLAVIPLCYYLFTNAKVKQYITAILPLLILSTAYLSMRAAFTDSDIGQQSSEILNNPFVNASLGEQWASSFYIIILYLKLLLVPYPLTHDYYFNQIPVIGFGNIKAILSAIVAIGAVAYALFYLFKKQQKVFAFSILYFFVTYSVVSNFLFTVGVLMNERFVFMPSLGFCILLAWGIIKISQRISKSNKVKANAKLLIGATTMISLVYFSITFNRNFDWKNNFTLFTTDVHTSSNSAKVQTSAGGDLIAESEKYKGAEREAMLNRAIEHLNRAIEIYPGHSNAWLLLGNATYKKEKKPNNAINIYKKAISLRRGYYDAYFNIGIVYNDAKQYQNAKDAFRNAVKAKPNRYEPIYNLGLAYSQLGMADSAIYFLNQTHALKQGDPQSLYRIGSIYGKQLNNLDKAIDYFRQALALKPKHPVFLEDLGVAYGMKGDFEESSKIFEQALQLSPEDQNLRRNLYNTYMNLHQQSQEAGYDAKAKQYLNKANQLANPTP